MRKLYKINKRNSTVCGYPGRDFDWSKFDWEGKSAYKFEEDWKAPEPWVDDGLIALNCQYLHVPYDFVEMGVIYRVRPNSTMYAGETYRGKLIKAQRAIKKEDGWYWELEFAEGE
uniref:Uncharacterized protein n=1 Tax=viral metagenome TaxID=1070528 RepID=A0A6H2A304_9ZZZZ